MLKIEIAHEIATVQIIMNIPSLQRTCLSGFPLMREDIPKFALLKTTQQWLLLPLECHYCEKKITLHCSFDNYTSSLWN